MTFIYPKHFRLLFSLIVLILSLNVFSQEQKELSADSLLRRISQLEQKVADMKKLYVGGFMHVQWSTSPQAGGQRVGDGPNAFLGESDKSVSPGSANVVTGDTYRRPFAGGYIHLVQGILNTKHSLTLKYDWYDPNIRLSGNEIGASGFSGKGDIAYSTLGIGYLYRMSNHVKLMTYYEKVANERSHYLSGYEYDVKDDVFTLRMQYWF